MNAVPSLIVSCLQFFFLETVSSFHFYNWNSHSTNSFCKIDLNKPLSVFLFPKLIVSCFAINSFLYWNFFFLWFFCLLHWVLFSKFSAQPGGVWPAPVGVVPPEGVLGPQGVHPAQGVHGVLAYCALGYHGGHVASLKCKAKFFLIRLGWG